MSLQWSRGWYPGCYNERLKALIDLIQLQWSRGWYPGCYAALPSARNGDSGFNGAGVGTPVVTFRNSPVLLKIQASMEPGLVPRLLP